MPGTRKWESRDIALTLETRCTPEKFWAPHLNLLIVHLYIKDELLMVRVCENSTILFPGFLPSPAETGRWVRATYRMWAGCLKVHRKIT